MTTPVTVGLPLSDGLFASHAVAAFPGQPG